MAKAKRFAIRYTRYSGAVLYYGKGDPAVMIDPFWRATQAEATPFATKAKAISRAAAIERGWDGTESDDIPTSPEWDGQCGELDIITI